MKRVGEALDTVECDRTLGPFEATDMVPVEVTHLRKLLLGELLVSSQFLHSLAEQNLCTGHAV